MSLHTYCHIIARLHALSVCFVQRVFSFRIGLTVPISFTTWHVSLLVEYATDGTYCQVVSLSTSVVMSYCGRIRSIRQYKIGYSKLSVINFIDNINRGLLHTILHVLGFEAYRDL